MVLNIKFIKQQLFQTSTKMLTFSKHLIINKYIYVYVFSLIHFMNNIIVSNNALISGWNFFKYLYCHYELINNLLVKVFSA